MKSLELSTMNWKGGKNTTLYLFMMICSGVTAVLFIIRLIKKSEEDGAEGYNK